MAGGWISYALLAALATALLVAAVTDLRRREIDNWLNLTVALCAPLYWLAAGLDWVAVGFQLVLALFTFVAACTLYAVRQMGGGDVKLLSALALWFVPGSFVQLIVIMGVIGGAASVAMAVSNMRPAPHETLRNALSTVTAAAWVLGACAVTYTAATGRSLIAPGSLDKVTELLPGAWAAAILGIALLAVFATGLRHIFRRQGDAISIPYGVAISAAGLWVLGQNMISGPFAAAS
ncbi:prepilin peptidase [Novosphingobium sp. 9U]|uniref:A24 family peptidase n=1 Tax=Novosphingobium sp. 9U TaxID=2653158 RepID=UPI0012F27D4A|nr:prepilin peptidase [Novosphingobium sp. 9U]VWX46959.1 Potassium:proton antiporter [Novosphingobium sp. 9U]